MKSILLTGPKGSGKTTVRRILEEQFGYRGLALADALKEEAAQALANADHNPEYDEEGWEDTYTWHLARMHDYQTKSRYRLLLQWWGTEFRRADDPDYWIKATKRRMRLPWNHPAYGKPVVIDDVSFQNEMDAFPDFLKVRVSRPGLDRSDTHASEVGRASLATDFTIYNDGGLEDLNNAVVQFMLRAGHWT